MHSRRRLIAATVCAAGLLGASGAGAGSTSTQPTNGRSESSSTAARDSSGRGFIAGRPFVAGSEFAQFDPAQKGWWLVIAGPGHACTDTTAVASQIVSAVVPDVSTFFAANRPAALPPRTRTSNVAMTFTNSSGYPTTLDSGVKITITHAASAAGAHWSGRISVPVQTYSGKSYGFTGGFNAVVCPPVRS
jgi:hypothetical protein